MTIKEIEMQSGMTRANIRFYEAEGLLNPERRANGYRNYSEDDLEVLKRIRLLRSLRISLEDIKRLHSGEQELSDMLYRHLAQLQLEENDIQKSRDLCKLMYSDGVRYKSLDAQHYLDAMEQLPSFSVPLSDALPEVRVPVRRFFARLLDQVFYNSLWGIFLSLILGVNITVRSPGGSLLDTAVSLLLMLLFEPLLLSLFGTTMGKWVLGLWVTDNEGRRLSYDNARARTWSVLLHGMGLHIPIYQLIRLWKSFRACSDGETLDWEYHSTINLKDEKNWRVAAYAGLHAIIFALLLISSQLARMPKNCGEITVAEFSDNYNRLSKYYGIDTGSSLNPQGRWVHPQDLEHTILLMNSRQIPEFIYSETDGKMTGMHFSVMYQESNEWIYSNQEEIILSILAFAKAQSESPLFFNETDDIIQSISAAPFESFSHSVYGVDITCNIEYYGYFDSRLGFLVPEDTNRTYYALSFSIQKQ